MLARASVWNRSGTCVPSGRVLAWGHVFLDHGNHFFVFFGKNYFIN